MKPARLGIETPENESFTPLATVLERAAGAEARVTKSISSVFQCPSGGCSDSASRCQAARGPLAPRLVDYRLGIRLALL